MESTNILGSIMNSYMSPEEEGMLYDTMVHAKGSWFSWISAVLGAFVVGLSGLVPLLIMPNNSTTHTAATVTSKNMHNELHRITQSKEVQTKKRKMSRKLSFNQESLQLFPNGNLSVEDRTLKRYLSFAVGGLLGDICLHLLPEIYNVKVDSAAEDQHNKGHHMQLGISILVGILSFLAIEKLFEFTQVLPSLIP